jgi:ferredoxin-thioredoxin reductase catalytic subunit
MNNDLNLTSAEIDKLYERLNGEAIAGGYHLNPDVEFTRELLKGLLTNDKRYGYLSCPCRLASGMKDKDLDIICPCDYRDPDIGDYGTCYCGLYVSQAVIDGVKNIGAIPERRSSVAILKRPKSKTAKNSIASLPLPIWRCRVCGYLCAREEPPEVCPICKAKKDRFETFLK